ncbi:MAG: restriction endonuclease [Desulfobacterales bacterium]|nr:restriction endonuclease [Desulfobacterales bacterium]
MTIDWKLLEKEFEFSFFRESIFIAFQQWVSSPSPDEFGIALLLKELVENGNALLVDGKLRLDFFESTKLSTQDQELLGFPPLFPFDLKIESNGFLQKPDFKYNYRLFTFDGGKELHGHVIGPIVELDDNSKYFLSFEQYSLINLIVKANALPEKDLADNLLNLLEIKKESICQGVVLDGYLQNEDVLAPEKIQLKVKKSSNNIIEVFPEIEGVESNKFEKKFQEYPSGKRIYSFDDKDGKRKRVVFNSKQFEEIKKIRKVIRPTGEIKEKILSQPQEVFNPEIIDLDQFSKRVKEIGYYKPRFYPFVCPYKSQWIPGFVAESSYEEREKIEFTTPETLKDFERSIQKCKADGSTFIKWKNIDIPINEAERIFDTAKRQFEDPSKPVKVDKSEQKVLIIKENIESLEHQETYDLFSLSQEGFNHNFTSPPFLKSEFKLLNHQKEGIAWLQNLCDDFSGGLLADDMGLGKTLQVLSFVLWHQKNKNIGKYPYLIVAPVSLLENWENEFKKFFQACPVSIKRLYGENIIYQIDIKSNSLKEDLSNSIVLTTYETLRRYQICIGKIEWAVCVLDEAQKIKTPGTLVTNAAKALKSNFKIAMTGTPVENSLVDLWCITDFVAPGLLKSGKEFAREYSNPLKSSDTDIKAIGEKLRKRIGIHIKRRMKADIMKDLPPKKFFELREEMPNEQKTRYKIEIIKANSGKLDNNNERKKKILSFIFNLRDISDHPYLRESQIDLFSKDQIISSSAKLKILMKILRDIKEKKEKAIVFAERRPTQKMLAKVIRHEFDLYPSIINGDTPVSLKNQQSSVFSRQQTIDLFQEFVGFNVIIMSPLAGGVGLNITEANHVIHYSRHWNPAKEEQATDRVYRIGQKKEVFVYYPMAVSNEFKTFDEILNERLQRKKELATASLFPTERVEINAEDIYSELVDLKSMKIDLPQLRIEDIDKLDAYIFESAIGALFQKMGFRISVTTLSNDKGADVVAFSENKNLLIQAKHSRKTVGDNSVGEILKAKGYYEDKYPGSNFSLKVVTNRNFTKPAVQIAKKNNVEIISREILCDLLKKNPINMELVISIESNRGKVI